MRISGTLGVYFIMCSLSHGFLILLNGDWHFDVVCGAFGNGAFWISLHCQLGIRRCQLCNCTALGYGKSQSEETISSYSPQKKYSLMLHSRGSVCLSLPRYHRRYFSICSWALLCFSMFCFHSCCHLSQMVISISGTQSCPLSLFFMLDSLPFPRRLQFPHYLLPFSKYLIFLVSCFNFVQHMFLT